MTENLDLIQQYATERHFLYRLAGQQHLTPPQMQRLDELNNQLPLLWDQHRRELASRYYQPYQYATGRNEVLRPVFQPDETRRKAA